MPRVRLLTALVMLAFGTAYVWHGVAFRDAERPDEIAIVRTWGDLRAQPAHDIGRGELVRLGIDRREVPRQGAALLYVLFERPAGLQGAGTVRIARGDGRPTTLEGPGDARAWLSVSTMSLHVSTDAVHIEVRTPEGETLDTVDLTVSNATSIWRGFDAGLSGRTNTSRRVDLTARHDLAAAPSGRFPNGESFDPREPPDDDALLPPLVPSEPDPWVTLFPSARGFSLRLAQETDLAPEDCLLARFEVGGAVSPPPPNDDVGRASVIDAAVNWRFEELGARPGDRVTIQVLWCNEGWVGSGTWRRAPSPWHERHAQHARLSNAVTIVVPDS